MVESVDGSHSNIFGQQVVMSCAKWGGESAGMDSQTIMLRLTEKSARTKIKKHGGGSFFITSSLDVGQKTEQKHKVV